MNMAISAKSFAKNQRYDGTQLRKENGADHPPRKSVIASPLIANMPIYSPRKNSANLFLLDQPAMKIDSSTMEPTAKKYSTPASRLTATILRPTGRTA